MNRLSVLLVVLLAACNLPAVAQTQAPGPSGNCYYVWASHELPDLSREVNRALSKMDPAVTGSAYAFGEDCIDPDGNSRFLTKETDFRVTVQVGSLRDETALGRWIVKVMAVIEGLPPADVPGPQPGRVEFTFQKNKNEVLHLQVSIQEYRDLEPGMSGADLLHHFQQPP
jgi:hypothetical protein